MTIATATREKPHGRKAGLNEIPANLPMLIDAEQAASIASTSPKFIRDHCQDGTIKAVKCGRVWRINRDAFLEQFGLKEA